MAKLKKPVAKVIKNINTSKYVPKNPKGVKKQQLQQNTSISIKTPATKKRKLEKPTHSNKKQRLETKVAPPTSEEVNYLSETNNLYHSNIFRLQVDEMLREVQIKQKYKLLLQNWLEKLKNFLEQLESETEKENIHNLNWLNDSLLSVPFQSEQLRIPSEQYKHLQFQFIKPKVPPYYIGAAAIGTLLGPQIVADVCLTMPAECFQKQNYINCQYEEIRALYLTYLTWQMLKHAELFDNLSAEQLKYNYVANNPLKPVLEITPVIGKTKLIIRLHVVAEESTFKLSRFVPWNNNIRASIFTSATEEEKTEPTLYATPVYNANILFDLTMQANQLLLRETFKEQKNFQEGVLLLKIWLRQRFLHIGFSGFHSHLLTMFTLHLRLVGKINKFMSSYQVARTVWLNLAQSNWDMEGNSINLKKDILLNQPTMEQMHTYYSLVFIDVTGFHNICANLTLEVYNRIRAEAQFAVDLLNDTKINSFAILFMKNSPPYTQFDHILK